MATMSTFRLWHWPYQSVMTYKADRISKNTMNQAICSDYDKYMNKFHWVWKYTAQDDDPCSPVYKSVIILLRIEEDSVPVYTHYGVLLQLALLLGEIGGYVSFISLVWYACFTQKHKHHKYVKKNKELTIGPQFLCSLTVEGNEADDFSSSSHCSAEPDDKIPLTATGRSREFCR